MAVPAPTLGIVRISRVITMRVVTQMISRPFRTGILQGPPTGDQEAGFYPIGTFKAAMRQKPMVSHGNTQAGDKVQDDKHRPIQPGISIEQAIAWDANHRACDYRPEQEVGPELMMNAVDNIHRNGARGNLLHLATIVKRKGFRKGLANSGREYEPGPRGQIRPGPSSTAYRRQR